MKKIVLLLALLIILTLSATVYADSIISLYIDNAKINCDVSPMLVNDRTLVPVRAVFDAFGAKISWNNDLKQAIIEGDRKIVFTVGSNTAVVDGKRVFMDTSPIIVNDRCLVPIRFISETLGHSVSWNQEKKAVYITKKAPEKILSKITDISLANADENSNTFKIKYDGENQPNVFVLSSSNAIVMDFYDTEFTFSDGKVRIESELVNEIRYARHDEYARVVIECTSAPKYKTELKGGIYTVIVGNPLENSKPSEITTPNSPDTQISDLEFIASRDENNLLVVVDAGHGGTDPGAVYKDSDGNIVLYEKDPNLYISKKLAEYLKSDGVNVIMVRDTDIFVDLLERSEFANKMDADLFVSVHNNSVDNTDVSGSMVLYNGDVTQSKYGITGKEVASYINSEIKSMIDITDRGIVNRPGLSVLKRTSMPAVLVECAFGTNEYDRSLLMNEKSLDLFARAIANGVEKSLDVMKQKIIEAKKK